MVTNFDNEIEMPGNPCAKGQERTNPISSHLEEGPQFIETKIITARSAETVPGSNEQSAPIKFCNFVNSAGKQSLCIFPIMHSKTKDNRCESRNYSLHTKDTQEYSSQSSFSRQVRYFKHNREKLTRDQKILDIVPNY